MFVEWLNAEVDGLAAEDRAKAALKHIMSGQCEFDAAWLLMRRHLATAYDAGFCKGKGCRPEIEDRTTWWEKAAAGNKLHAIRQLNHDYGMSLVDAKARVEAYLASLLSVKTERAVEWLNQNRDLNKIEMYRGVRELVGVDMVDSVNIVSRWLET